MNAPRLTIISKPCADDPNASDWLVEADTYAEVQSAVEKIMNDPSVKAASFGVPTRYWPPGQPKRYRATGVLRVVPLYLAREG